VFDCIKVSIWPGGLDKTGIEYMVMLESLKMGLGVADRSGSKDASMVVRGIVSLRTINI
jgi:hypothetical protein